MDGFYKAIGYKFNDENLAKTALTHSSYANENGMSSYERLEFLGDALLSVTVSEYLYRKFPDMPEGVLTKIRAASVCEKSLHKVALNLGLGKFLYLNKGEEASGGRKRSSILSDIVEATIAAIYLDSGMQKTKEWIMKNLTDIIDSAVSGKAFKDYKTLLQEYAQGKDMSVRYVLIAETGPAHEKSFEYEVYLNETFSGNGRGASKKEAEQMAAKSALEKIGE